VREEGAAITGVVGRRPFRLAFNPAARLALGISMDIPEVSAALVDMGGTPRAVQRVVVPAGATSAAVLDLTAQLALRILRSAPAGHILGVGMAVPGIVSWPEGVNKNSLPRPCLTTNASPTRRAAALLRLSSCFCTLDCSRPSTRAARCAVPVTCTTASVRSWSRVTSSISAGQPRRVASRPAASISSSALLATACPRSGTDWPTLTCELFERTDGLSMLPVSPELSKECPPEQLKSR